MVVPSSEGLTAYHVSPGIGWHEIVWYSLGMRKSRSMR